MRLPLTNLRARVAPAHTAVLIVDMQNDFCAPGGYIDSVVKGNLDSCRAVAQPIEVLLAAARSVGVPAVWLRADYRHARVPEPMLAKLREHGIVDVCCEPGTWGYDWFEVRPGAGEPVVDKHCYSGFAAPALDRLLRERDTRTIVFCGVQTHVCVESTLRDAHSRGYFCVVPEQCVASHAAPAHAATLATVRFLLGDVVELDELLALWASAPAEKNG